MIAFYLLTDNLINVKLKFTYPTPNKKVFPPTFRFKSVFFIVVMLITHITQTLQIQTHLGPAEDTSTQVNRQTQYL